MPARWGSQYRYLIAFDHVLLLVYFILQPLNIPIIECLFWEPEVWAVLLFFQVIQSNRDEYLLNDCKGKTWFVVELCESIRPSRVSGNCSGWTEKLTPTRQSEICDQCIFYVDRFSSTFVWVISGRFCRNVDSLLMNEVKQGLMDNSSEYPSLFHKVLCRCVPNATNMAEFAIDSTRASFWSSKKSFYLALIVQLPCYFNLLFTPAGLVLFVASSPLRLISSLMIARPW